MQISRKGFIKSIAGIVLARTFIASVAAVSFVTGCSTKTVADAIIASFGQILTLLQNAGVVTNGTLIADAKAALAAFQAAFDAFKAGTGTAQTLANAAQAALTAVQAFFAATQIGGPLAQVIVALAQIVLSTLISFLPAPAPSAALKLAGSSVTIAPVARTHVQYLNDWNAICVKFGHPEAKLK